MDIYGTLSRVPSFILAAAAINPKAKGVYLQNNTGSDSICDIKLYSPGGATPVKVTIALQNGASIVLPCRVYSIGPGYFTAYEIY